MAGEAKGGILSRIGEWRRVIGHVRRDMQRIHGRAPALLRPRGFADKIQWRKLFDDDPRLGIFCDKLATRRYVTERAGPGHVVPVLWSGERPEEIPFDRLEPPYVLKSSHASGHLAIIRAGETPDLDALRETARGWLCYCHGRAMVEPGYLDVPRRLIAEPLIAAPGGAEVVEYRLFAFDGRLRLIQCTIARGPERRWSVAYFDGAFRPVPFRMAATAPTPMAPPPPDRAAAMCRLAALLATGVSHLRVDIYDAADGPMVNELTPYCWSGLQPFRSPEEDLWLGETWRISRPALTALRRVAFGRWGVRAS